MFILFSETDLDSQTAARDVGRKFAAAIDKAVYGLLGIVFQLFFSVASADIFSSGMISKFYARIQLIIGVFVLFQLAMTILRGIVNPEGFTDSKSGAGNIVMRICTALVMLALIVPINIPSASNEFEKQINNNGLLFGTLYSLQHRILTNNTIGKVVMGVGDNGGDSNYMVGTDNESFKKAADTFTSTILKGFYRINLVPESERKHEEGKEDDQINDNRVCTDIEPDVINEYKKIDANPGTIIDFINITCEPDFSWKNHFVLTKYTEGTKKYAFTFMPVVSSIIGIVFVLILLGFCVDVAVRAIKLAILRLLAPIPIITYMDPKGGKDGAFSAWTKALISTYLDLFIRVASVYFVIYMIQEMLVHGITTNSTGTLKVFTVIFIWIGLFYFAKEAPKFIKQVLGIKDDGGGGIFSGLGKVVGLGAAAGGMIGSAVTNWRAQKQENEKLHPGQDKRNFGRQLASAIAGGIGGGFVGAKAALGKDASAKSVLAAQQQRNAQRAAHSTLPGRIASSAYGMVTGRGLSEGLNAKLKANQDAFKDFKDYKTVLEEEALKKNNFYGSTNKYAGKKFNYSALAAAVERARNSGASTFTYDDGVNKYEGLSTDAFDTNTMNEVKSQQAQSYSLELVNNKDFAEKEGTARNALAVARHSASVAKVDFGGTYADVVENNNVVAVGVKTAMGDVKSQITEAETDMKQIMRRQNDRQTGNK